MRFWFYLETEGDVAQNGEVIEESVVLEHEASAASGCWELGDVRSMEDDLPVLIGVGEVEASEEAEEGCLAGSAGA